MTKKQIRVDVENLDLDELPLAVAIERLEEIRKRYPDGRVYVETCQEFDEWSTYTIIGVYTYRDETDEEYARRQRDETLSAYLKNRDELRTLEALAAKHGKTVA